MNKTIINLLLAGLLILGATGTVLAMGSDGGHTSPFWGGTTPNTPGDDRSFDPSEENSDEPGDDRSFTGNLF